MWGSIIHVSIIYLTYVVIKKTPKETSQDQKKKTRISLSPPAENLGITIKM